MKKQKKSIYSKFKKFPTVIKNLPGIFVAYLLRLSGTWFLINKINQFIFFGYKFKSTVFK